jgi:hypothetical protein
MTFVLFFIILYIIFGLLHVLPFFILIVVEMQEVYSAEFGPKEAEKTLNTEMTKEEKDAHNKNAKLQCE